MIKKSFKAYEGIIHCKLLAGTNKSDIFIKIGNESHTYSIKMGRGNSIHQEPLDKFLNFLEAEYALKDETKENLQRFIWADGTTNGTGDIKERISSRKFKKRNPQRIQEMQTYFDTLKEPLIERFLIQGIKSESSAEFIYYGTVRKGVVCKSTDVLDWVSKHNAKGVLHIGKLTFQAWNRNLKGKKKAEKKRGIIQLKWGGLKKDIQKIAKVNLGKQQEIDFVKTLNEKENLSYWATLRLNPSNHYAIHVKYQKYGTINQQKVWAKADAFIAKGDIPKNYLKLNHFFLNEDAMKTFNLIPIKHTGISIKQEDSSQYQILKMAPSTFKKLFNSNILGAGASVYYKKKKKLVLNKAILRGWNIDEKDFFTYYNEKLNLNINSVTDSKCQKCLKQIKRYAKKEIIRIIKKEKSLSDFVFLGIGNFQEPFTAPWLFEEGEFKKNHQIPFTITTGSGRSRGKYSIVVKPK
ncbi:MAG: AciI [uncultured Sulfurovum sp.]|uniref:AciI n=1 Tax=uncultured Sulfurovum sp. TaxID=269237 RepID=A0A6S6STK8_9BACT|nr:MAG: AciI [uncultured Sulfurovum sp.]